MTDTPTSQPNTNDPEGPATVTRFLDTARRIYVSEGILGIEEWLYSFTDKQLNTYHYLLGGTHAALLDAFRESGTMSRHDRLIQLVGNWLDAKLSAELTESIEATDPVEQPNDPNDVEPAQVSYPGVLFPPDAVEAMHQFVVKVQEAMGLLGQYIGEVTIPALLAASGQQPQQVGMYPAPASCTHCGAVGKMYLYSHDPVGESIYACEVCERQWSNWDEGR